jgi:hypothetical protein
MTDQFSQEMRYLIPSYLETDFLTAKARLIDQLKATPEFADYDFEGANITTILEMHAYMIDLNTYYVNRLAKNMFVETADQYDTVSMIAKQSGYEPIGYKAGKTYLTLTIQQPVSGSQYWGAGEQIYIEEGAKFYAEDSLIGGESSIQFVTTEQYLHEIEADEISIVNIEGENYQQLTLSNVLVYQGEILSYDYIGSYIIDNQIILPKWKFAHNEIGSKVIRVTVNDVEWERVADFYDGISGLQNPNNNVYNFKYDKYKRYVVEFSESRNVPSSTSDINIRLIRTLGETGAVGKNQIQKADGNFLINADRSLPNDAYYIPLSTITITNPNSTLEASAEQNLFQIKNSVKSLLQMQYRTINHDDFTSHLNSHQDVIAGRVWGEQEENPEGDRAEYNKLHVSVYPSDLTLGFNDSASIQSSAGIWLHNGASAAIYEPRFYYPEYREKIKRHLEPYKTLTTYEVFEMPDLIYFAFDISLRIKSNYSFRRITLDLLEKLVYYFNPEFRNFGEVLNFMDIHNWILDTTIKSPYHDFNNIVGINNLVFREILSNRLIYNTNGDNNYPQYTNYIGVDSPLTVEDQNINILKPIQLGNRQFPMFSRKMCTITQELI